MRAFALADDAGAHLEMGTARCAVLPRATRMDLADLSERTGVVCEPRPGSVFRVRSRRQPICESRSAHLHVSGDATTAIRTRGERAAQAERSCMTRS